MKKNALRILTLAMAVILLLCGCGEKDQTITNNGLSITIPGDMTEMEETSGYTFVYSNEKEAVIGLYEDNSIFAGYGLDPTLEEYCDMVLSANGLTGEPTVINGLITFTHQSDVDGQSFSYLSAVYKSSTGFWLIQCSSLTEDFSDSYGNFINYLSSVQV